MSLWVHLWDRRLLNVNKKRKSSPLLLLFPAAFEHWQLCAQKTGFERVIESLVNAVDLKKKAKLSVIVTPPECH
jgi:hypothetical protein